MNHRLQSALMGAALALFAAHPAAAQEPSAASPDPRVGLKPGLFDAGEAVQNLRLLSTTPPSEAFVHGVNTDLAFIGKYVIQGSFSGYQVWDISDPRRPALAKAFLCPASQSDVSVYKNLLFVSGEDMSARLDCGTQGVKEEVSPARLRGIRILDITDIANPKNVASVQTCRGSHTHSLLVDPKDPANVYVYVSGSSPVRPEEELKGCVDEGEAAGSATFRLEVIKVPLAHPEQAAIVSSPRIFNDLAPPPEHGMTEAEKAAVARAKASGAFIVEVEGEAYQLSSRFIDPLLDSIATTNGRPAPNAADSAALRDALPAIFAEVTGGAHGGERTGPTQCHDITLYPAAGIAGGACEGYGFLLDIKNPANPKRVAAVADSNFSYWHSATFSNDASKVLFSDEWGGGGSPKCRAADPKQWGADAIFSIEGSQLRFRSYYKLPAAQTQQENCVAHNGSLIPIPGRDVMVQSWYQGGISVFDWTDPTQPHEIAFFDRGPATTSGYSMAGSWSVYWYNGLIVSSEIARGLDILELAPSPLLTQNEIDAARSVRFDYVNTQGQQRFVWPPSFSLARAYVDQLERSRGLAADRVAAVRGELDTAEKATGGARRTALTRLAGQLDGDAGRSSDGAKVKLLAAAARDLAR